jgi:hypothetical protein
MDLLCTDLVAITNTVTVSYPCLLHWETLNSTAGIIWPLLVFLFIFQSIYMSDTTTSWALKTALCTCCAATDCVPELLEKADQFSSTACTAIPTLAWHHGFSTWGHIILLLFNLTISSTLPLIAGVYVYTGMQNTTFFKKELFLAVTDVTRMYEQLICVCYCSVVMWPQASNVGGWEGTDGSWCP